MFQLTITSVTNGKTEMSDFDPNQSVKEFMEWIPVLLGPQPKEFMVLKDGKPISNMDQTLQQAGIVNGDLLVVQPTRLRAATVPTGTGTGSSNRSANATASSSAAASTNMDFSSLISGATPATTPAPAPAAGLDFSSLLSSGPSATATNTGTLAVPPPVSYPGMTLDEAIYHNPHPQAFIQLLFSTPTLFNQLNYHKPELADRLRAKSVLDGTSIWREELTKGSIRGAMAQTERLMSEEKMKKKLQDNPEDSEAVAYFAKKESQKLIEMQYRNVMENYPESMGKILMLYIDCHINGYPIQAFVDSGAQSTIMTRQYAEMCGIANLIDTRFAGQAVGVGTGVILGRIHLAEMRIGKAHFPITITVMEKMSSNNDMKFLLGLDNLKRFTCSIDLENNVLRFKLGHGEYMEAKFLHEKDLGEEKGGTLGFDAEKANRELQELRKKRDEDGEDEMKD